MHCLVDVLSTAIAEAVEVGEGDAVALAIAASLKPDCKRSFLGRDCPDDIAQDGIAFSMFFSSFLVVYESALKCSRLS